MIKDFSYFLKIFGEQFKALVSLKITALPMVLSIFGTLCLWLFDVNFPTWAYILLNATVPIMWVFLVILRRARKLELSELIISFDKDDGCRKVINKRQENEIIFFRLKAFNSGSTLLKNCSAKVVDMKMKQSNGKYISLEYGENVPLVWSNTDDQARKIPLQPKVNEFVDVIMLNLTIKDIIVNGFFESRRQDIDTAILVTKNLSSPISVSEHNAFKEFGSYILSIRFSADEILAVTKNVSFEWNGNMQDAKMSLL
jgi:hypothetical protein